jgi:RHS repeat-associated protein
MLYTSSHALSRRQYSYSAQAVRDSFDRAYRTDSLGRLVERANGSGSKFQTFTYINDRLTYWEKRHQTGTPTCINLGGWGYDCSGSSTISDLFVSSFYDLVGNPDAAGVQLDPGNRLRTYNGVSMLYDADGNLVKRTGATTDSLVWDDFGQLKAVRQGSTTIASFAYDGFGRRIRKVAGATTVHYIWDGDQITAEADGSGTIQQTYSYYPGIDKLHSVTKAGQTYYASIEPATGDINGLINGSTNAVVATYAYTPWGEIESSTQQIAGLNSLRWKGLLWDDETKLYYMRARYYDPKVRRFISEDPIGLSGGINMYAFANNDPVNGRDPFGLDARECEELYMYSGSDGTWTEFGWVDAPCSDGGGQPPIIPDPRGRDWPEPPGVAPGNPGDRGPGLDDAATELTTSNQSLCTQKAITSGMRNNVRNGAFVGGAFFGVVGAVAGLTGGRIVGGALGGLVGAPSGAGAIITATVGGFTVGKAGAFALGWVGMHAGAYAGAGTAAIGTVLNGVINCGFQQIGMD